MEATVGVGRTEVSKGRRVTFRVLAIVFGAAAAVMLWGYLALIFAWFDDTDGGIHRMHDLGWGVFAGLFLATGILAQARRPEAKIAGLQMVAAALVGFMIGSAISGEPSDAVFVLIPGVALAILVALHPSRTEFLRGGSGLSPVLTTLTVIGAVPLLWLANTSARLQRNGLPADPHVKDNHFAGMAVMAICIVLVALVASTKTRGWRVPSWCAGLGLAVYGLASALFPDLASSEGAGWGIAAIAGGIAFIGAAEWEAHKAA